MPRQVLFGLILLLATILTGLRDGTSWLPSVPATAAEPTPALALAAR